MYPYCIKSLLLWDPNIPRLMPPIEEAGAWSVYALCQSWSAVVTTATSPVAAVKWGYPPRVIAGYLMRQPDAKSEPRVGTARYMCDSDGVSYCALKYAPGNAFISPSGTPFLSQCHAH